MHDNLMFDVAVRPGAVRADDNDSRYVDSYEAENTGSGIIWFEGLSAAGKTTIANAVQQHFAKTGTKSVLLDGDQFRHTHSRKLGFSRRDRRTNILRAGEVAVRFAESGVIVLAAFITPLNEYRSLLRKVIDKVPFYEVFCDCPIDICRQRDPKGLYHLASAGQIKDFTGVTSPFEIPDHCDLVLPTHLLTVDQCVHKVFSFICRAGMPHLPGLRRL